MKKTLIVQKYGGASLSSIALIKKAAQRISFYRNQGYHLIVVVSAMGNMTNELFDLAHEITADPHERELDMLLTAGERISISLLSMAINSLNVPSISFTGSQSGIITDRAHTNARIQEIKGFRILDELQKDKVVIIAGFQGVSLDKEITTLGRGGSDTSAVALAASFGATRCEFYKDVTGVYSSDPKLVSGVQKLETISYDLAHEMSLNGSKILHKRALQIAKKYQVPLVIKSCFEKMDQVKSMQSKNNETQISSQRLPIENERVISITKNDSIVKIVIDKFISYQGALYSYLGSAKENLFIHKIAEDHILIDNIALNSFIRFFDLNRISYQVQENIASICLVGEGLSNASRLLGTALNLLNSHHIPIFELIGSSFSYKILLPKDKVDEAIQLLHSNLVTSGSEV